MTIALSSLTNAVLAGSMTRGKINMQATGANGFRVSRTREAAEGGQGFSILPAIGRPITLAWSGQIWLIAAAVPALAEIEIVT